jgi:MinD superfamily P-loop ATPase
VLEEMNIPFGVVVNRAGIGDENVYGYCEEKKIPVLLEIPFRRRIAELYSRGVPFAMEMSEWRDKFRLLFDDVKRRVCR